MRRWKSRRNKGASSGQDQTDNPDVVSGTQLEVQVAIPGFVSVTATRTIHTGHLITAATYNRHLSDLVKVYGELDGVRVEFGYGRPMPTWEIGMFVASSSPLEALSIVARHSLRMHQVDSPLKPVMDYQAACDQNAALTWIGDASYMDVLDDRPIQASLRFSTVKEAALARMALEYTARAVALGENPDGSFQDYSGAYSSSQRPWIHAKKSYGLRFQYPVSPSDECYMQVTSVGWACGGFIGMQDATNAKRTFLRLLNDLLNGKIGVPELYYHAVLADCHQDVITGDFENDLRCRVYLSNQGKSAFQKDSSLLLNDDDVVSALDRSKKVWEAKKEKRRTVDGTTPANDTSVYDLILERLRHSPTGMLYVSAEDRRDEHEVLASQDPVRRTMSSIERVWFENLFEGPDKVELGWIKRRKKHVLIETRTEFFVVLPVERSITVWTKRSLYNSLELPWRTRVQSHVSLPAISALCLFSSCIYPDRKDSGRAALDDDLFKHNIRNAGHGIGYALRNLLSEFREAQLRDSTSWSMYPLSLSSLVELVWRGLPWLDNQSKSWIVRETITLWNMAGVHVHVRGVQGRFSRAMLDEGEVERRPAIAIDRSMPAGGVQLFQISNGDDGGVQFIAVRKNSSYGTEWTYRALSRVGNMTTLKPEPLSAEAGAMVKCGIEHGTEHYD